MTYNIFYVIFKYVNFILKELKCFNWIKVMI